MPNKCEECKANAVDIARNTPGTPTAKLIAILEAHGITNAAELAEIVGISDRAVRKARNHSSGTQVPPGTTGPEPQDRHGTQVPKTELQDRNHSSALARANKESSTKINITQSVSQSHAGERAIDPTGWQDLKSAFNGSTEAMLADVQAFMGPIANRGDAVKWLSGTLSAYGQQRTAQAWTIITAKRAQGEIVANPLPLWAKTAGGMKPTASAQAQPRKPSRW